jgi:hypothetical protein
MDMVSQRHRLTLRTVWAVDPGKTDVFVAVDSSSTNPHRVRKTSTKEYYDLCGFNQATNKRRRWLAAMNVLFNS